MGCDICRAEAQISISESDKCLIPSSTFQHVSGLSENVLEYTHTYAAYSRIWIPRSAHLSRGHTVSWIRTTSPRARTRGDFLMDHEDLSECTSRLFCMEITQFWNSLCGRVSLKDNPFVRGKNIYNAYTVIFTRHSHTHSHTHTHTHTHTHKKQNDRHKIPH